jgi:hypothetical protein
MGIESEALLVGVVTVLAGSTAVGGRGRGGRGGRGRGGRGRGGADVDVE